jgi:outer membrane protein
MPAGLPFRSIVRRLLRHSLFLLVGVAAVSHAQATRLGAVLEMARASDPQYLSALAAMASARERLPQAVAAMLPNVSLSVSSHRNRDASTLYPGTLTYSASSSALTITQPLYRLGIVANKQQAEVLVSQAEQQLLLADQDLRLRVARAFFDVLQAGDEVAAAEAQKDALVQQLAQARRSFEVGMVPITDLNEAQSRHDLAVAQDIAARNELASKQKVLEKLIGRPLPVLATLARDANVDLLPPARQRELVEAAPSQALPVLIARDAVRIAELELKKRATARYPTLDLVASERRDRNLNFSQFGGSTVRQTSLGLEFVLPIYQGGAVSSRDREAAADMERARQDFANAQRQASLDAFQALLGVESGSALTRALQQALASSQTQLRSIQRGLQVGIRTRVDVLNAEQQLFATRKDLAAARYRTLTSILALKAAAGALTDPDLFRLDTLLDDAAPAPSRP